MKKSRKKIIVLIILITMITFISYDYYGYKKLNAALSSQTYLEIKDALEKYRMDNRVLPQNKKEFESYINSNEEFDYLMEKLSNISYGYTFKNDSLNIYCFGYDDDDDSLNKTYTIKENYINSLFIDGDILIFKEVNNIKLPSDTSLKYKAPPSFDSIKDSLKKIQ